MGFWSVLTLIFITLKLTGYIGWSWWLVLLPAWGGLILVVVVAVAAALMDDGSKNMPRWK